MKEKIEECDALDFQKKLAKIRHEVDGISKDADNSFFKSKYVDLNQIIDAIRPFELDSNLSISFHLEASGANQLVTMSIKDLDSDESEICSMVIPSSITDPQKVGSCITYYRRYMLMAFFNLKAEDDDGNYASGSVVSSNSQPKVISPKSSYKPNDDFSI